jgi:hypothetical protein
VLPPLEQLVTAVPLWNLLIKGIYPRNYAG